MYLTLREKFKSGFPASLKNFIRNRRQVIEIKAGQSFEFKTGSNSSYILMNTGSESVFVER